MNTQLEKALRKAISGAKENGERDNLAICLVSYFDGLDEETQVHSQWSPGRVDEILDDAVKRVISVVDAKLDAVEDERDALQEEIVELRCELEER